jgi:hypothetical protein
MLQQLRAERPDVPSVLTGNAANTQMLPINTRPGYRPYARLTEWQADIGQLATRLNPSN